MDVIYCSAGLPLLFPPFCVDDLVYLDGGLISNYPINHCLKRAENPDEIMGLRNKEHDTPSKMEIHNLFDYIYNIIFIVFVKVMDNPKLIKNQIEVSTAYPNMNLYNLYNALKSYDERVILFDYGVKSWVSFYEKTYPENCKPV
jgi:predicted acylesterase/phospholipase RssA